jgi:hypothetical protein
MKIVLVDLINVTVEYENGKEFIGEIIDTLKDRIERINNGER